MTDDQKVRIIEAVAPAIAQAAVLVVAEQIRERRAYHHPVNRAGRALGGLWRSIASGGWE